MKRKSLYYLRNIDRYLLRFISAALPSHKPSFMIIGAQKAATTSLYNYLNQLPGLKGSTSKEIYYFEREINYQKDLDWYHCHFKGISGSVQYFEATPNYLYYPWVAERLYKYNPELKLIVVLREPVSRAYSAWNMYKGFFESKEFYRLRRGLEPGDVNYIYHHFYKNREVFPSFGECIRIELDILNSPDPHPEPALLRRGRYAEQLQRYYKWFKPEQIITIGYGDLTSNPHQVVNDLYTKLTGNREIVQFKAEKRNSRAYSTAVSPVIREELNNFFAESNNRLWDLLGRKINW